MVLNSDHVLVFLENAISFPMDCISCIWTCIAHSVWLPYCIHCYCWILLSGNWYRESDIDSKIINDVQTNHIFIKQLSNRSKISQTPVIVLEVFIAGSMVCLVASSVWYSVTQANHQFFHQAIQHSRFELMNLNFSIIKKGNFVSNESVLEDELLTFLQEYAVQPSSLQRSKIQELSRSQCC